MSQPDDRPPKPVSEKKRAANRANARKSTGPKTEAGKARVSLNALTHGLTASAAVLPFENEDHFEKFAAALRADLRPRGFVQELIVERMVDVAWKLRRAATAISEHAARRLDKHLEEFDTARKAGAWTGPDFPLTGTEMLVDSAEGDSGAEAFLRIEMYADRLQRAFHQALRQLRREQRLRAEEGEAAGIAAGAEGSPDVEVELKNDPVENARFGNEATSFFGADGKPIDLKRYWTDPSEWVTPEWVEALKKTNSKNKAKAAADAAADVEPESDTDDAPASAQISAQVSAQVSAPVSAPVPAPARVAEVPQNPPPAHATPAEARGAADLARDDDPWRQVPPSHPLYRGPHRGGG